MVWCLLHWRRQRGIETSLGVLYKGCNLTWRWFCGSKWLPKRLPTKNFGCAVLLQVVLHWSSERTNYPKRRQVKSCRKRTQPFQQPCTGVYTSLPAVTPEICQVKRGSRRWCDSVVSNLPGEVAKQGWRGPDWAATGFSSPRGLHPLGLQIPWISPTPTVPFPLQLSVCCDRTGSLAQRSPRGSPVISSSPIGSSSL